VPSSFKGSKKLTGENLLSREVKKCRLKAGINKYYGDEVLFYPKSAEIIRYCLIIQQ